jgi:hypothetical protein
MSRRRIVLVDQYFPPDTAATARIVDDFRAACVAEGVPLTIVCGYPSYDPVDRPLWRPLRRVRDGAVTRFVVGSSGFDRRRAAGRVANYATFMAGAALLLPFVCARAALVVMTDPPMAPLLAWWARRVARPATVAIWFQDLHPDFGVAAGVFGNNLVVRTWRAALRASLRAADDVIVLGRDMARRVEQVGVAVPTRIVHNGWSGVTAAPVAPGGGPLKVMHFGNLGFAGPWPSVIAAARQLEGVAEFVFVGGGASEDVFADAPVNVTVAARVPHDAVPAMAAGADLLLVGTRDGLEGYVMPSKGYEMMALGRPLLVVANSQSEIRLLVEERACGITVDDDPAAIVACIKGARPEQLRAMADRATQAAEEFRRDRQFASLVGSLSPA